MNNVLNRLPAAPDNPPLAGSCPRPYINARPGSFKPMLNRAAFEFTHSLASHQLFALPRLAKLADSVIKAKSQAYVICKVAESTPNAGKQWQNFSEIEKVSDAIANIDKSGSWVMIGGAQIDPDYQTLLDQLVNELEDLTSTKLRQEITWIDAFVYIGSPNSVTHFHIDSETNLLFQVHGTKEAHLFDQADRTMVSHTDLEKFYVGGKNAATFKPEFEERSKVFDFKSGRGIHIPVNAPHWVKNMDDYSVTFSVLFYTRPHDARARVYQMNHCLRRLGLDPMPPGISPTKDFLKSRLLQAMSPRNPKSKEDVLSGGISRIIAAERSAKAMLQRLRPGRTVQA